MRSRPSLPQQARHEAATRLVGLGLYREAQNLLNPDDLDDAELGMRIALLAGDPRAGAKFLGRRMMASKARPGEIELMRGCVTMVSGRAEGLGTARLGLEKLGEPAVDDWAVFAAASAPHDLDAAAEAASKASDRTDIAVLAVIAAARAAGGDVHGAHTLLEAAAWSGVGDDPRQRAVELLKGHGHEGAVAELDTVRFQKRSLGESWTRRMDSWRRRRNDRDLRCRCSASPVYVGESSRYYVNWHLELLEHVEVGKPPATGSVKEAPVWRVLFCARSGVRYLDRASIPVSVRIGAFSEPMQLSFEESV
ncbi:hypothetical protein [Kineosporia succinea]|uniref:Uncharacterized protein n=1 Tax=Kineosporia succinea TaxID=84632 RepID=A0ABT9P4J0_9ACTN|nr:hypothetical protein [Kineosporia succinea]MDP9827324.1 hypothetical protein [Kineosporia succinea]